VLVGADNGTIVFPYDEVHVDFVLRAARDDFSAGAMEEALPESCPRRGVHSKVVTVTPIPYVTRKILQRPGFAPARSRADIHTT
jgi:hypothetical protein